MNGSRHPETPDRVRKKNASKIESSISKKSERRLVEYFIVISSVPKEDVDTNDTTNDEEGESNDHPEYESVISSRYPLQDHKGNPLSESVTMFCHPSGRVELKDQQCLPKVHYFVTTGGRGRQIYGVCLTIYEPDQIIKDDVKITVYLPKCICILSAHPYLVAFREYLTQLHRLSTSGEMTLPIERYITNFCSEIPAPPPGSFEVQTTIQDSVIKLWSPPHNQPIAWVSLPFSHLFECLDLDNIITFWKALALERQILVVSTQLSLLTTCCEIMLSLLYPMKWSHAYIPVLPRFMIPILSAPMPYFCGLRKNDLGLAINDLSPECIVVDLDTNQITMGPKTEKLPSIPAVYEKELRDKLDENAGMQFLEARSLTKGADFSDRGMHLPLHVKTMADAMWESKLVFYDEAFHLGFTPEMTRTDFLNGNDNSGMELSENDAFNPTVPIRIMTEREKQNFRRQSKWDAVQESFMSVYIYLLSNYRDCLVYPSKEGETNIGTYGGAGFRSTQFVQSQRHDAQDFLKDFIKTQMFDDFVTKRLYGSGAADVVFFDQAIDKYLKKYGSLRNVLRGGQQRASQKDEPLLQSARIHRKLKTIVPPEPSAAGLETNNLDLDDGEKSVASSSTHITAASSSSMTVDEKEDQITYNYPTFPSELKSELFGMPRPLPPAVLAEFERQRENAGKFRRYNEGGNKQKQKKANATELSTSPEVTTFSVFFSAFTAVVGKELLSLSSKDDIFGQDKYIMSSYIHSYEVSDSDETSSDEESTGVIDGSISESDDIESKADEDDAKSISNSNDESKETESISGDKCNDKLTFAEKRSKFAAVKAPNPGKVEKKEEEESSETSSAKLRKRFQNSLTEHEIEEAKVTAKAQLGLAFEILEMMRERGLNADPVSYQCLIAACGRCGDTERATNLLSRMHEDGIVADGAVYSSLVSAFSSDNAWNKVSNTSNKNLPEWANGASVEVDWNTLKKSSWGLGSRVRNGINSIADSEGVKNMKSMVSRPKKKKESSKKLSEPETWDEDHEEFIPERFVTESVLRQISFGENLLEILYPDIIIDTDDEKCPRCDFLLSDDDVVNGWTPCNSQDYTTKCPLCPQKFVPHFRIQCVKDSFVGSKGPGSPLYCERLSPWVLQKELRLKMGDREGIEDILDPSWREKESKNAVLWWNLILSFMRYRFPFTFLLQGSFQQKLIAPMPEDDEQ